MGYQKTFDLTIVNQGVTTETRRTPEGEFINVKVASVTLAIETGNKDIITREASISFKYDIPEDNKQSFENFIKDQLALEKGIEVV